MSAAALLAEDRSSARMRGALYAVVTAAVVLLVTLSEWGAEKYLSHFSRTASTLSEIAIVVVLAFAFREIHRRIERTVEAAFTKRREEARKRLFALARGVTAFRDAKELLAGIVGTLDECVGGGSAVYVKGGSYHPAASSFPNAPELADDDALVALLRTACAPVDAKACSSKAPGSLACPMIARGELVGFVVLAASMTQLAADDRQTIMALAQAAGLALAVLEPYLVDRAGATLRCGNLPSEVATLIGRDRELEEIVRILRDHRMLCVKGHGGIGKSRLALRAAAQIASSFSGGAWFVDLTSARDEAAVLDALAGALGVPQTAVKRQLDNVLEFLGGEKRLIVLDNCEHVVGDVARMCSGLLRAAGALTIVATSRERIGIAGEAIFEVPPLDQEDSARLFCERAADVAPALHCGDYEREIAEIVAHLDGIPFAIELAAARLRVLSPRDLAKRIGDLFATLTEAERGAHERHQTLRTMLDWSYALLNPDEQILFAKLSVFPSTFGLDAAAEICSGGSLSDHEIVGLLGHLVDKSLVQSETSPYGQRFRLLQAGRVYARERAGEHQVDLRKNHAAYYSNFVREIMRNPAPGRYDIGLDQLQIDADNIYAALSWALNHEDVDTAAGLAEELSRYWFHFTQLRTGREWLAKVLAHEDRMSSAQRAAVHFANALMLLFSDPELALRSACVAVELSRGTGDRALLAQALGAAGNARLSLGKYAEAERAFEESAAIYDETNPENASLMRVNLANVIINFDEARLDRAQELLENALGSARASGRKGVEGIILGNMAQLAHAQGRDEDAYALSRQSVEAARALGARQQEAVWLYWLGTYATQLGRRDEAAAVLQQAMGICREILADDAEHFTGCLEAVVTFAASDGRMLDAAHIHGFIETYRRDRCVPRPPVLQARYDALVSGVRDALGESEFAQRAAAGSRESVDALLSRATEVLHTPT